MDKAREETIKEVSKKLLDLNSMEQLEDLLKDNKIEFVIDDKRYRVRKPTYMERQEVRRARSKKYIELLKDDNFVLKSELIKLHKANGVDIEDMEHQVQQLQNSIKRLQLILAKETDEKSIESLKKEIEDITIKQTEILVTKSDYLSSCIEAELVEYANLYMTYVILEEKKEEKWVRAFNSIEEFLNAPEGALVDQAVYYSSLIIFNRGI